MLQSSQGILSSSSSTTASVLRAAGGLALVLTLGVALAPSATQAQQTFNVNSTADGSGDANVGDGTCANSNGVCTLRAAIDEANDDSDRDVIDFSNVPTTNNFATISLNDELLVNEEIDIDGTTAPNYPSSSAGGPIVKLDGSNISGTGSDGIDFSFSSSESRVIGLAIVNMPDEGIDAFVNNVAVLECFVGVDVDGQTVQPNNRDPDSDAAGVKIEADDGNVRRNVVSGNQGTGIQIEGNSSAVLNNTVGLNVDGDAAKGNGAAGIDVNGNNNLIGDVLTFIDPITGELEINVLGNTVSANAGNGIVVTGDNNVLQANNVGTSDDGSTSTSPTGVSLGNGNNGIVVKGTGSDPAVDNVIGGGGLFESNLVSGNDMDGIALGNVFQDEVSGGAIVRGNVVGLNADEDTALPNGNKTSFPTTLRGGIVVSRADSAVIDSNTVAGNEGQGIIVFADGGDNDADITDNIVGTNRNFASGLGNAYDGIQVKPNPSSNSGGTQVVENIVGNNANDGIDIRGSYHDVSDNYIGVAPDGSDIGNGDTDQGWGIKLDNGSSSLGNVDIGAQNNLDTETAAAGFSTPTGEGNVIGYNRADGILVRGQAASINIRENYVGTNPNGDDLGNGTGSNLGSAGDGIRIVENDNIVDNVEVGYDYADSFSSPNPADGGEGNVVAYNNNGDGISAGSDEDATSVSDVTIRGNSVFQNGAADKINVGIDLGNSGKTPNDTGDEDSGPNNVQNFPNIQSVSYDSGNSTVTIDYDVPTNSGNADFSEDGLKVDFYAADSEQSGEGKIYLGSQDYSTANAKNVVSFDLSTFSNVDNQDYFVATATDASGNTSEFFGPLGEQLPVELANFEGTQSDKSTVDLRWTTASERSNAGFRVQRRKAAGETGSAGAWQKVGFVESKAPGGTTTETTTYRLTAEDLGVGAHEFRLKQVDLDGTTHLHDPVTVELQMQEALKLGAPAPNPVQNRATISFAVRDKAETTITLYNTLGQVVRTLYRGTPGAGEGKTVDVSTTGLSSGVYFLRLRADGRTDTQRLTVVR